MPISTYFDKSTNTPIILFQFDLLSKNIQWINIGSGIWEVNFDNIYSFVDSSLLDGFTIQNFDSIASILVDTTFYTKVNTLLLVTSTNESFYYDSVSKTLWLHIVNNDEPILHQIKVGAAYGYSYKGVTPINATSFYSGRLLSISSFNKSRDPLFFGKLSFPSGSGTLANGDGFFDTFIEDNNLYGNPGRILLGYDELDIGDYEPIFTGYIGNVDINEENAVFSFNDKRAQLTKKITANISNTNALEVIEQLLLDNYGYGFTAAYYDITAWNTAKALVPNITINYSDLTEIISIIEEICISVFGFFDITRSGLFTFRFVDITASATYSIQKEDIFNTINIAYDSAEVISSVNINYSKDWTENTYTAYSNTTREIAIFDKYQTYYSKDFNTLLINLSDAQTLSETILDYTEDVHGIVSINVPIKYWNSQIGDIITAELSKGSRVLLGTKKCEVIGVIFNFDNPMVTLKLRIY